MSRVRFERRGIVPSETAGAGNLPSLISCLDGEKFFRPRPSRV